MSLLSVFVIAPRLVSVVLQAVPPTVEISAPRKGEFCYSFGFKGFTKLTKLILPNALRYPTFFPKCMLKLLLLLTVLVQGSNS